MNIYELFVHLLRVSLDGDKKDSIAIGRKSLVLYSKEKPEMVYMIKEILSKYDSRHITRNQPVPIPIDSDSRLELIKRELVQLDIEPIRPSKVESELNEVIEERIQAENLLVAGLFPTRSILFVGPPGVGKTLAAKWLATKLNKQLLTLDLASVMSSFLGKTGANIRAVLKYAQNSSSILLLDEFDSIAKKRSDDSEIGELKRLVTVLLQTIYDWPSEGLLISATNHPELLDPAVWRRFDRIVEFPKPNKKEAYSLIRRLLEKEYSDELEKWIDLLSEVMENHSFSDITRQLKAIKRNNVLKKTSIVQEFERFFTLSIDKMDKNAKMKLAQQMLISGRSQRQVSEITGISRDTLRRHFNVELNNHKI